jgi:hypothetical protein
MGSGGQRSVALRTKQSPMGILFYVERKELGFSSREKENLDSERKP